MASTSPDSSERAIAADEATEMDMDVSSEAIVSEMNIPGPSAAADLDSRPLTDLGVSVMDQDVLERNVAAQVRPLLNGMTDMRLMLLCRNGRMNLTNGGWKRLRQRKSTSRPKFLFADCSSIERQIRQLKEKVQSPRTLISARHALHSKIVKLVITLTQVSNPRTRSFR